MRAHWIIAALAASCLAGCGGGPRLVPVSGTVTINGEPFEGAEVLFSPDPDNEFITKGLDITGPDGGYLVMHPNDRGLSRGVSPGKYKVTITEKPTQFEAETQDEKIERSMMEVEEEALREALLRSGRKAPQTQGGIVDQVFEIEVSPEGGTFEFDVKAASNS